MGRPRLHGKKTREELLLTAEAMVARGGSEALSLRRLATSAGTTTRAVYSLFGNKEGLFGALYRRAFQELIALIKEVPLTRDPRSDLVRAGLEGFRRYALEHPNLFRLVFERIVPDATPSPEDAAVGLEALETLRARVRRCAEAGLLGKRSPELVATQFHSLCQGLASQELRGALRGADDPRYIWKDALTALMDGLERPTKKRRRRRS